MLAQQAACYSDVLRPQLAEHGHPSRRLGRPHRRAARGGVGGLRHGDLAGADAAQPRCGASVSVRLEPLDLVGVPPRGPRQRRVGARAGQGAERAAAVAARAGGRGAAATRVFVGPRPGDRAPTPRRLFPGMVIESASLFSVCRDAEVEVDDDEGESKRALVERGAAAAPLRARRPARGAAGRRSGDGRRAQDAVRADARRRLRDARAARLHDAVRDRRAGDRRRCATRRGRRFRRSVSRPLRRRHLHARSAAATSCSTSRTTASTRASSGSSARPPTTR